MAASAQLLGIEISRSPTGSAVQRIDPCARWILTLSVQGMWCCEGLIKRVSNQPQLEDRIPRRPRESRVINSCELTCLRRDGRSQGRCPQRRVAQACEHHAGQSMSSSTIVAEQACAASSKARGRAMQLNMHDGVFVKETGALVARVGRLPWPA